MPRALPARRRILRLAWLPALAALLPGCDEMRRPPGQGRLPAEVDPGGPDPVRGAAAAVAAAFANQGQRLAGQPEAAARAIAQFEYLYDAIGREPRFAALGATTRTSLRLAREEIRQAVGTRPEAPAAPVIEALAQAIRALRQRNRNGAAGALPGTIFNPGGVPTLLRLSRPGPLPTAEQATAQLVNEIARLDAQGGWSGSMDRPELGIGTPLSPNLGRGV
ncbi:MAG TPA: hypothetical protein VD970_15130 [Acetobacteraceae bacterium]|nr:hypothetical protein [Acetobacteraceae bacterium]